MDKEQTDFFRQAVITAPLPTEDYIKIVMTWERDKDPHNDKNGRRTREQIIIDYKIEFAELLMRKTFLHQL